jgi:hypothetical protein
LRRKLKEYTNGG